VIVGQQWGPGRRYQRQLQALATRLHGDKVLFLGPRDDVPSIYADLDLALHPSLSENVGGAVESLLAACPTVASNVGGLPDLVQDGVTGWLVPPRRPDLLAEAMLDALAHPEEAHRRAHRGRELARVMFDVNRTGREIVAIYGKLMGSPQGVALGDTIA
jgi:glycosyltransferase involved in cell wall biosynthesis